MKNATIRMYNVGFGDAFLLRLPDGGKETKVLFDCGSHAASQRPRPMPEVVGQIIEDVRDPDGTPRIDVVVATHRHQDHVSGFDDARWAGVEVREVWMPWTEDYDDPEATRIREAQSATARRLHLALELAADDQGLLELAANQLTNADAMKTVHDGFAGSPRRRFLPGAAPDDLSDSPLGAFNVRVLGPARDERVIRDMDPPAGEGYLRMIGLQLADEDPVTAPFNSAWVLDESDLARDELWQHLRLSGNEKKRVHAITAEDRFAVAVTLDKAINGTSLVIVLEVGDAVLLFPADAQWGSWDYILADADRRAVVERTTFLKVGHHGSHNATPRDFVELLKGRGARANKSLTAMVSTHSMKNWPKIPKKELLQALGEVTPRVARSDLGGGPAVEGFDQWGEDVIELQIPVRRRRRR